MTAKSEIAAGDRIVHPELGGGVVRRLRRGGRALLVNFDSNPRLLLEVNTREVNSEFQGAPIQSGSDISAGAPVSPETLKKAGKEPRSGLFRRGGVRAGRASDQAARTLEALRLGVVPHGDLRASSVGRDPELELVRSDLDQAAKSGAARVFLGDYGAGKTHLLELIEREALHAGFLVGRATFDAEYIMPSHPMRVYREVVSSLIYPDSDASTQPGLAPLFRKAVQDEKIGAEVREGRRGLGTHLYLRPALHYFKALEGVDDPVPRDLLLDWISGQRSEDNVELDAVMRALFRSSKTFRGGARIYSLKDFQPWAHVYSYLLGGISVLARRSGYRGLVVLLDEAENFDLLGTAARAFAETVFSCLALAALGPDGVTFDEKEIRKGGFSPQRRLPLMFRRRQHLYLVSAMTPSTTGEAVLRRLIPDERMTELGYLSQESYHELSKRVAAVFETAYPEMAFGEKLSRPLGDVLWSLMKNNHIDNPREATKLTIEFLDLIRLRSDALSTFFADVKEKLG